MRLYQRKKTLEKLVPHGLTYGAALKLLQVMNYDLCLINIELAEEADRLPYDIIMGLPFSISELTELEKEVLEEYCVGIIFHS